MPQKTTKSDRIWLTFDDGPSQELTVPILEILARHQVTATFFVLGQRAIRRPDLVRRVFDEGHIIANHSMNHLDLARLSRADIGNELNQANDVIRSITGVKPRYFRPPFGRYNRKVLAEAKHQGLETVLWSVDPCDWASPGADKLLRATLDQTRPGSIILLHDGCGHLPVEAPIPASLLDQMAAALPQIVQRFKPNLVPLQLAN